MAYGKPRPPGGAFSPDKVRKVLLIRRNGIGDMICALPLIRNIRAAWPGVKLDVLASDKNACVLDRLGVADHVHVYWRGKGVFRNHYFNLPRIVGPIREQGYDLLVAIKGGFSPLLGVVSYATQIPWRLGYVPSHGHPMDFCFNLRVELPDEREHQVESCLRFLDPLGIARRSCDLSIRLDGEHEAYAARTLGRAGLRPGGFVLFNGSARRPESRWTSGAIQETARELERRHRLPMLLCGVPEDRGFFREVQRHAGRSIRALVEPPSIHHFAALVARSHFLMCGDGGPMHVAAAVGKPVFVLFSATDPRIWRPYGVPFAWVQKGRLVADLAAGEALARIDEWLSGLPPSSA